MVTKYIYTKTIIATMLLIASACSLDIENVNGPTDTQVLQSRDGVITLSVGMRQVYASSALESIILTPGTTSHELRGITTFTNIIEVDQGGSSLPNFNGNVLAVWQRPLRVMGMADNIIANAPTILANDAATLSGVMAHAQLFKAMSLGALAQSFTHGILETSLTGSASFVTRDQLLDNAIALLKEAAQRIVTTPPSAEFTTRVTSTTFHLANTIQAYLARYSLMAGNYADAIAAARAVSPTVASVFTYTTTNITINNTLIQASNPLWQQVQTSKNYAARDNFGLPADLVEAGDGRLGFYFTSSASTYSGDPVEILTGFAKEQIQPIPAYIPDEMKLIIAEANVRGSLSIPDAVVAINAVRTQASGDPFGIHPNLPPYSGALTADALLTEIYKQRCAELYLSGLRLEDSRRFGRAEPPSNVVPVPLTYERSRNFYPFPQQERQNNPNTPADPAL